MAKGQYFTKFKELKWLIDGENTLKFDMANKSKKKTKHSIMPSS